MQLVVIGDVGTVSANYLTVSVIRASITSDTGLNYQCYGHQLPVIRASVTSDTGLNNQ